MAGVKEIVNPFPGRVPFLSACQVVEVYLSRQHEPEVQLPGRTALGVKVLGLGSGDTVALALNDVALVQPGMPLFNYAGDPLRPGECVTIRRAPPSYTELEIVGDPATVHGPRGETVSYWVEALMGVYRSNAPVSPPNRCLDGVYETRNTMSRGRLANN
jgi:hypothetical protein